jgi:hypothetical protein
MTRTLVSFTAIALVALVASAPAGAARSRRATPTHNQTRPEGGPSALGLPGTHAGQMVRIQQQRAQRGAARKKSRQSPREQLLAARDRQLGVTSDQATFSSRREAAAYTRMRARVIQIRTFAVAIATGIGGGFFAKMVSAMGALQSGYHNLPGDPNFGNPMAQVLDHHFAIGAVIGAGVALVVGSVRAAQLRRRADAIERGDVDVDLTRLD